MDDDAGSETRGYGPLGELVRATRTVRPYRPGDTDKLFETRFAFDAFGRMRWIQYPDGEKVTYGYDAGGLLRSATGKRPATPGDPVSTETYLQLLTYDEHGQRRIMRLGNGSVTTYDYYPESRRLRGLNTTAAGRTLQALGYRYDRVGNVLELANALPAATGSRSGPVKFVFGYDDLYRLTSATGTAESRPGVVDSFAATYAYDEIHNMTRNTQVHVVNTLGLPGEGTGHPPATNHDLDYAYEPAKPHQATRIGDTHAVYDASGNVDRECRGAPGCGASADGLRRFYWTEENRLAAVIDGNGSNVTRFVYDAAGDRVAKLGRGGESLSIGQFFALKGRKAASKHVFAGTTRIATKLSPPPGWQPADPGVVVTPPGEPPSGSILPGCLPSDYQPSKCPAFPGGDPVVVGPPDTRIRPETYYYHSDHLGSTGWITDQNARVHEHVEYFPYGQIWRDVRQDADGPGVTGQRFLFTGKELDEETGLYYFGARYYEPTRARWYGVDPRFIDQAGLGNADPMALSVFFYANGNPSRFVDPDGEAPYEWADWIQSTNAHQALSRAGAASEMIGKALPLPPSYNPFAQFAQAVSTVDATVDVLRLGTGAAEASMVEGSDKVVPILQDVTRAATGFVTLGAVAAPFVPAKAGVKPGSYRPARSLPRDPRTGRPVPDSPHPHTQLGTKVSKKTGEPYTKAREFGDNGRHVRDVDFTDHGRSDHPNPHQHHIDPSTGKRGPPKPLR